MFRRVYVLEERRRSHNDDQKVGGLRFEVGLIDMKFADEGEVFHVDGGGRRRFGCPFGYMQDEVVW